MIESIDLPLLSYMLRVSFPLRAEAISVKVHAIIALLKHFWKDHAGGAQGKLPPPPP